MTFGLVTSWIRTSASQIRGERIFPGGRVKSNIRPMTVEELKTIRDRLNNGGKQCYWAKELHIRIRYWDWENPRDPSS